MRVELVEPRRTHALRRAVLRPGLPPEASMPGDTLEDALHLGALDDDDVVIGTCVVAPQPYPLHPHLTRAWQLRAMATAAPWRGRGVGTAVIATVLAELRTRDAALVWCNARLTAVDFYLGRGFRVEGAVYVPDEVALPHRRMWRPVEPEPAPTSSARVERSDDRSRGA